VSVEEVLPVRLEREEAGRDTRRLRQIRVLARAWLSSRCSCIGMRPPRHGAATIIASSSGRQTVV
jgi:hypothetical protein